MGKDSVEAGATGKLVSWSFIFTQRLSLNFIIP